ncbi:MAG: hypothetical protein ACTSQJ_06600 [Promethearchaeota archaeon]
MDRNNIVWIGILFGIIWSCVLHLAKAMERHGIELFDRNKSFEEKGKKPLIYIIGFILNNTGLIWAFIALQYSTAVIYSSMFGIGLILLMLYSHYILKEDIETLELIGAVFILVGTIMVGILYILEEQQSFNINFERFYILLTIIIVLFCILFFFSLKTGLGIAFIFGMIAGALGGMDNVFKWIGLKGGLKNLFFFNNLLIFLL